MAEFIISAPVIQVQVVTPGGGAQTPYGGASPGATLAGIIIGKDDKGNFLLKTDQGTFSLQSSQPLTFNSDVVIHIGSNVGGNIKAQIISVNGEPYASFSAPTPEQPEVLISSSLLSKSQSQPAQQTQAAAAPAADIPEPANGLRAVVVNSPVAASATPAPAATIANATLTPPAQNTPATPSANAAATPTVQNAPAAPANSAAALLSTGNQVIIRLNPAVQPTPSTNAAAPTNAAATATQTVVPASATPVPTSANVTTVNTTTSPPAAAPHVQSNAPVANIATQPVVNQAVQTNASTPQISNPTATPPVATNITSPPSTATPTPVIPGAPATIIPKPAELQGAPLKAFYGAYTPATASQTSVVTTPAAPITGQVVAVEPSGLVTVQTPLGNVSVQLQSQPSSLPAIGSAVSIEAPHINAVAALSAAAAPASLTEIAASWNTLKDIVRAVQTTNPAAAKDLLARLPQLDGSFAASSLGFARNLLRGDTKGLLGEKITAILTQNAHGDLVSKFSAELQNLRSALVEPAQREQPGWQTLILPFVFQEELQQARLYVKRDAAKKNKNSPKATGDTRFVVEVDLTELGPLQMDGLVRQVQEATAFDLIIRSSHAFSPATQHEITGIYNEAAQITGFKGAIAFQTLADFTVKPLGQLPGEPHSITV